MRKQPLATIALLATLLLTACHSNRPDPNTVVFLIETSPTNLDPRIGFDEKSAHIDELLFDGLVLRDENFRVAPALAQSWDQPDPLTVIFHLRPNVHFSDGRLLTSRDVLWTINSMRNGSLVTPKSNSYVSVAQIEAPDPATVIFHLNKPDNFLLVNLSSGAIGIVPEGSGRDFGRHPIGTGAFKLVSQEMDKEVVIERNPLSWQPNSYRHPIKRVRFAVVPDGTTRALELRKGSADIASNSIAPDVLPILAAQSNLQVESSGGTQVQYLSFNTIDPILKDPRVRQAIACAIDRNLIIKTLLAGRAKPAASLLPEKHWAYTADVDHYDYNPARAEELLNEAGYPRHSHSGIRLHLTMKTSTDDQTRLLAATFQQQLAQVGIALDIRSYESATFVQDLTRGSFQMYALRWAGANEQPDIFSYAFSSIRIPPKGANRGRFHNPELDALLEDASRSTNQDQRSIDYKKVQQILARELPSFNLWYQDVVLVHSRRLTNVSISPSGSFAFLRTAKWE